MTESTDWLEANDRHLDASLKVLRLRLERLAETVAASGPQVATTVPVTQLPPDDHGKGSWWRRGEPVPAPEPVPALLPAPTSRRRDLDAEVAAAEADVREIEEGMSSPPALAQLAQIFELHPYARDLLLLVAAPELDPGVGRLLISIHGQPWPTYSLAAQVLDEPDWESRSPGGALRRWRLVEADQSSGAGLSTCRLSVDERVLNELKGLHHLDARLAGLVTAERPPAEPLPESQQGTVEEAVEATQLTDGESALVLVQLVGASAACRRVVAGHVARALNGELYRLQPRLLPTSAEEVELLAALWHREVLLGSPVLLLDEEDGDTAGPGGVEARAFLARTGGLALVGVAEVARDLPASAGIVEVGHPTRQEQLGLWRSALALPEAGSASAVDTGLEQVVEQFDLDAETISAVATKVRARGQVDVADLWDAVRRQRRPRLESAAQRIRAVATWDDLVLPEQQLTQLEQIASQVRHRHRVHRDWGFAARMNRGLGVSVLFAGESGTGKSMTAEVLARDLDLDLFRIDLSAVVSKYIGETEKNLRHLFDAAEGGGVILFFDEADALFGKRSEVKDAHDRYANIETNYLLQRMEAYGGLAILATNMRSAIDKAFGRRMRFVVEFPFPSRKDRLQMWARAFPDDARVGDLDLDQLARIDLTGAGIASAALAAAFTAAADDRAVSMADVLGAAREELRKLERPVVESQFRLPTAEGRAS